MSAKVMEDLQNVGIKDTERCKTELQAPLLKLSSAANQQRFDKRQENTANFHVNRHVSSERKPLIAGMTERAGGTSEGQRQTEEDDTGKPMSKELLRLQVHECRLDKH